MIRKKSFIVSDQVKKIITSKDPIAPVGYLKVEKAHLELKQSSCKLSKSFCFLFLLLIFQDTFPTTYTRNLSHLFFCVCVMIVVK